MFVLVDCNNFFVSCERVFNPYWIGRPTIVLSNNDGCVIARSNEAKSLGIEMAVPAFRIMNKIKQYGIGVFSGNQNLYGDMSCRVMSILSNYSPDIEVYSIDESFLDFSGFQHIGLHEHAKSMVRNVYKGTGIPVSAGVAPTKTLAKIASVFAKKYTAYEGVCVIDTEAKREKALKLTKIGDVWGIGNQYQEKLDRFGIKTAYDFLQMPVRWARQEMTVFGERVWRELNGEACLNLNLVVAPKKQICTSRSFGNAITEYSDFEEAVTTFASMCSKKLRNQHSCAFSLMTFVSYTENYRDNMPREYANSVVKLPVSTNSTLEIVEYALLALRHIYQKGRWYKNAGVMLMDISSDEAIQQNLFDNTDREKHAKLMAVIDDLNSGFYGDQVTLATQGTGKRNWRLKQEHLSPCYTTKLSDILSVKI